jgi:hypothetical protein
MPYQIVQVDGGFKVRNTETDRLLSANPQPHRIALAQFRVLEGIEHGWRPDGADRSRDEK